MILSHYHQRVKRNTLQQDNAQLAAVKALDALAQQLSDRQAGFSLYLYGPVGRGKSMLMDLFFEHLPIAAKTRLHYHHFMKQVHDQLNAQQGEENPLTALARAWSKRFRVICLDEFIVEDIGDAMLLATLWSALFKQGTLLVTTSNTPPHELYRGGLARHRFEPFIALLQQHCRIMSLDSGTDYRRLKHCDFPYYLLNQSSQQLQCKTEDLLGVTHQQCAITVMNRVMHCLWRNPRVIGFNFWNLCAGPRSQRDYMELAGQFEAIVVDAVPQFSASPRHRATQGVEDSYLGASSTPIGQLDNEARRFIALVDECYDRDCLLIINAAAPVDELYQDEHLKFPFQRCVSRLYEMQQWRIGQPQTNIAT